jgi:RNA polymerase sigma-70 factor (ECF subfamily)
MKETEARDRILVAMTDPEASADSLLPTRRSLLSRLKSWDEQDSWHEFFETYWRLIFDAARRAGLDEATAQDVVQETVIAVAKEMPGFRYDRGKGSFKGWLLTITKRRIADALRRQYRAGERNRADPENPAVAAEMAGLPDAQSAALDELWEKEWQVHLTAAAVGRVKRRVKPEQFQLFDLYVLKGWPVKKVAAALGVSAMQVYLARHRVGSIFRSELERLASRID